MVKILFEDNHVLAVEKPAGLLTQPSGLDEISLEAQAKEWIKEKYAKQGGVYLHAVHRLDRAVSGIVLFAKTSKALSRLSEQLRERKMQKTYFAVVEGVVAEDQKELKDYLIHDDFFARVAKEGERDAKLAILKFRVLQRNERSTLLEIDLETGRFHQIRAQLSHYGHPILGDGKYQDSSSSKKIHLHHGKLSFFHPVTKTPTTILSPHSF
jgi:23S rRNA pseudouridine1911/1915/1917 synthase